MKLSSASTQCQIFFPPVLRIKSRDLCILGKYFYNLATLPPILTDFHADKKPCLWSSKRSVSRTGCSNGVQSSAHLLSHLFIHVYMHFYIHVFCLGETCGSEIYRGYSTNSMSPCYKQLDRGYVLNRQDNWSCPNKEEEIWEYTCNIYNICFM